MVINQLQSSLFDDQGPARLQAWAPGEWLVGAGWPPAVDAFWASTAGAKLAEFVRARLQKGAVVYPPEPLRALVLTPLNRVKVVILGQDPYHGPGQAEGLAFSVAAGMKVPPSLRNMFKELQRESLLDGMPLEGSLLAWAREGVLLLNTALTVEDGQAASHAGKGWEVLTDALLARVAATAPHCAYLLWGAHAQAKADLVAHTAAAHGRAALILKSNHPSPLSALRPPAPFIGCGHFGQAQSWLAQHGQPLSWALQCKKNA